MHGLASVFLLQTCFLLINAVMCYVKDKPISSETTLTVCLFSETSTSSI